MTSEWNCRQIIVTPQVNHKYVAPEASPPTPNVSTVYRVTVTSWNRYSRSYCKKTYLNTFLGHFESLEKFYNRVFLFGTTLEPLNSGPLNSGKPLINRHARLDKWIFHYIKTPH